MAGGPGWGWSPFGQNGPENGNTITGLTAGAGGGVWFTNAKSVCELEGPFNTWNLNLPLLSIQVEIANGIWMVSATYGKSWGASGSGYPTKTKALWSGCKCR